MVLEKAGCWAAYSEPPRAWASSSTRRFAGEASPWTSPCRSPSLRWAPSRASPTPWPWRWVSHRPVDFPGWLGGGVLGILCAFVGLQAYLLVHAPNICLAGVSIWRLYDLAVAGGPFGSLAGALARSGHRESLSLLPGTGGKIGSGPIPPRPGTLWRTGSVGAARHRVPCSGGSVRAHPGSAGAGRHRWPPANRSGP